MYLQSQTIKRLTAAGCLVFKFNAGGTAIVGMPDLICLTPFGQTFFIEIKGQGDRLRPCQEKRIKQLREMQFEVFVVKLMEDVEKIFLKNLLTMVIFSGII